MLDQDGLRITPEATQIGSVTPISSTHHAAHNFVATGYDIIVHDYKAYDLCSYPEAFGESRSGYSCIHIFLELPSPRVYLWAMYSYSMFWNKRKLAFHDKGQMIHPSQLMTFLPLVLCCHTSNLDTT